MSITEDDDRIDLLGLLDIVLEQKKIIAAVTLAAMTLGSGYVMTAAPIFEANTLIQIEDSKGSPISALMGEAANMFDIKSSATAEIEILRSRLVVGQAVTYLKLDLDVTPKYLPIVGEWLSRYASEPTGHQYLGSQGYVSGNDEISVRLFDVEPQLLNTKFTLVLTTAGFDLFSADGNKLGASKPDEKLDFVHMGNKGSIIVGGIRGTVGSEFFITRRSHLAATEKLQSQIKIAEKGKQSGMLLASLEGEDPQLIGKILNEIGQIFVRQNTERKSAEAEKSLAFLNTQLPYLKKQLDDSENKFNEFRTRKGTFDITLEAQSLLKESVDLKIKLTELQAKRKDLATRFTDQHPNMQALDSVIKDNLSQIKTIEAKVKNLPTMEQDMIRLTRDVQVGNQLYTDLLNSYQQLRLVKEGKVGNVRIVDTAVAPENPVKPKPSLVLALAALLGLFAGLGLAFLRNAMRPGIRNVDEIEHQLGLHVYASVPFSANQAQLDQDIQNKKPGNHLLASHHINDPAIESLRSLRTSLQFAMLDAPNNIVLITGATPNLGKSFTSANFAAVIAVAGKRVLLIDADMRKGHINTYFGKQRGMGLSELITGTQTLDNVLQKTLLPNLDFISTGSLPPNPAELLMSSNTSDLLKYLSSLYDIVMIDSPPVLAVSDTAIFAPQAGTTFLVARSDVSTLGELQETTKRLSQSGVTVKGVIFNGLDLSKRRYGYGYKYNNYAYRYKQYNYGPN